MNLEGFHPFATQKKKNRMTERCSSLVPVASGTALFTLLLRRRDCHLSATLQTMSVVFFNLQDNRAVFRIFIPLLMFSCDYLLYFTNNTNLLSHSLCAAKSFTIADSLSASQEITHVLSNREHSLQLSPYML